MKILSDIFTFAQQHEATMVALSAWFARECISAIPFVKWIWNSELGVFGIIRRFLFGVSKPQPQTVTTADKPIAVK